jgi:hypothetical protein
MLMTKHLLGTILQAAGLLNREQTEQILAAQAKSQETGDKYLPFGEVALHLKLVTIHQLRAALEIQKRLVFPNDEAKRLGVYLLELRLIKPDAMVQALDKQRVTHERLEKVLVDLELIPRPVMQSVLQTVKPSAPPRPQPSQAPQAPVGAAPAPPRKPPSLEDLLRENHQLKELVATLRRENAGLKERLARVEST